MHYASDASARMMRLLRKEWRISLNSSKVGVIKRQAIDQAIEKVRNMERTKSFVIQAQGRQQTKLFCHLSWHITQTLPKARGIVDKHWSIIDSSDYLSTVFPQKPIMAYRRPQNASETILYGLDWSQIGPMMNLLENVKPCGRSRCQTCKMIKPLLRQAHRPVVLVSSWKVTPIVGHKMLCIWCLVASVESSM